MADFSCPDWFAKLQSGRSPLPDGLPIDAEEARLAVETFKRLRLPDVPGRPTLGETGGDWAFDFVAAIFGTVKMSLDRKVIVGRHARKFVQLVPKKNSKTTNGAAIMLTALLRNRRPQAEFLLVGPTQATAERAYEQAWGMIDADRTYLDTRFHRQDHIKTIRDRHLNATLKIRSFDTKVMTGAKPVGVLLDELHEIGTMNGAAKVMSQIDGGILPNPEGFIVIITTQSLDPPTGVFESELAMARAIRDGEFAGGETLPMLYEFPKAMQEAEDAPWRNPANWPMVLPNLGKSISIDRLLPKWQEAQEKGPEAVAIWASQHLNIEIGIALNSKRWRGVDYWMSAEDEHDLDALLERCEVVVVGIDGGGLDDLFALTVLGRERNTHVWLSWTHAWAHPDVYERRKDIVERLEQFRADGDLTLCENPLDDVYGAADIVEKVFHTGLMPERYGVGIDPHGVSDLVDELDARGIRTTENDGPVAGVTQGYKLVSAVWGMERKLKSRMFRPAPQRLARWCASNACTIQRGNAVVIDKEVSGKAKIDPLMSAFNAYMLMSRNPQATNCVVPEGYSLCA